MGGMTGMIGDAFANQGGQGYNNPLNQLPIGMDGQVLTGNEPQPMQPAVMPPGDAGVGMGGKGGMPMPGGSAPGMGGKAGGPLSQIPIDMNGNLLGGNYPEIQPMPEPPSMGGLPPAPIAAAPLARVTGGTPGRPSAAAPMVPRGPGFANPGAPGAPPQQPMERNLLAPPQTQPQPSQPRLQPAPAAPAAPIVNPRARVSRQPVQSMKQGRGAGRGGMLR
jgi:hypothetical protein